MTVKCEDIDEKRAYEYEEAISIAGTGRYTLCLLATMILSYLAMYIDMLSFSTTVLHCACDFQLTLTQKSVLVSMPFVGPVVTAYLWGYVSDTRGRRKSLLISMSVSFLMSTLCAFSPNWIALAIFKLIGTCFSSCSQSATFTLLGESCPEKVKGKYLLIMSSIGHVSPAAFFSMSYLIGFLDFTYDLGWITFVPWRLLALLLALPLGISAVCIPFFYESPKFLLNAGQEEQALDILRKIHRKNCGTEKVYPVQRLVLSEEGNIKRKDVPLLKSLVEQTVPLFKPPLLFQSLLLFLLIGTICGVSGSLYVLLPFITNAFTSDSTADFGQGLCSMIVQYNSVSNNSETDVCKGVSLPVVISCLITGFLYCFVNCLMGKFASRKKMLTIVIFVVSSICCFITTVIPNFASAISYFGIPSVSLGMGTIFVYFVELYPTSFRGMVACLGVMVARLSSMVFFNIVGQFITTQCTGTFYTFTALLLGAALCTLLLPPDKPKPVV